MIFIHPAIDPVIFSLGIFEIRWYGLAYVLAFILGIRIIKILNLKLKSPLENITIDNFLLWSVVGVILGGRIGYVIFYQFQYFIQNPKYIFLVWEGGMSFHGGLIGMIVSILFFSKKNKLNFFILSDLVSMVAPIGLFLGRIANFINIELIGRPTDFPFAIIYSNIDSIPRHPAQLYEAFFEGVIIFFILLIIFIRKNLKINPGFISGVFLFLYGIFRFNIEFLREPDMHIGLFFNFFSMGQILCIPIVFFGLIIVFQKKNNA